MKISTLLTTALFVSLFVPAIAFANGGEPTDSTQSIQPTTTASTEMLAEMEAIDLDLGYLDQSKVAIYNENLELVIEFDSIDKADYQVMLNRASLLMTQGNTDIYLLND